MINAVEVARSIVEVETRKTGAVVVPPRERVALGEVVPKPRNPPGVTMRTVVVALGPVEEAMVKRGVWESAGAPAIERRAQGVEVPTPKSPFVMSVDRKLAESRVVAPE